MLNIIAIASAVLALGANAHTVAWNKGMYCLNGTDPTQDNPNTNTAVGPLFELEKEGGWWFQADRGCDKAPPAEGDFLELPAGGNFTVELAHNRAQTTFSYGGKYAGEWPDGKPHPEDWHGPGNDCIQDNGSMHTQNETMAAGTAFAISYTSELSEVTMENLVVFTVAAHTPWKRLTTYQVPKDLPACPPGGCTCAWLWVPQGCGTPNMYMAGYKCNVTGSTSTKKLATAQVPKYCAKDKSQCVAGAKQMLAMNQKSGNNVELPQGDFVAYNTKWGFASGAQNDIFE